MEINKIDLTSTTIEKGIDLISGFIEKLAGSTIAEAGLIFGDKMKVRRLKNQIKIFSDVQKMAEENNISLKQINLKTLVPLLEFSSLEEEETLQQRWSNLILNFSDASQNYESSIFPSILNQLSSEEVLGLEKFSFGKKMDSNNINLNAMQISNLKRLGLLERYIIEGNFFSETEMSSTYFLTEIGQEFTNCCKR